MNTTRILDFGKNKGHQISECDTKYLQWLVSHTKVLAERNQWSSRDAAFELDRREWAREAEAARKRIEEAEAAMVERKPVWSLERCCYVWSDSGERVAAEDKPKYSVVSLGHKKERFDLVGYVTQKSEGKRNMLAECREIKAKARQERLNRKPFSILR
jgi:hypothetical protein